MGDRRKRLRTAPSCSVDPSNGLLGGQQLGCSFYVDTSSFQSGSFVSRCSVRLIHQVVSKFDDQKKDLVKSTGFEGILHFPTIKQFNRKFSLWLMSCVNVQLVTINVGHHICIRFNKVDVGHVFGIPSSGKTVLDSLVGCKVAKNWVIQHYLGSEFNDKRSVKIVQEILERNYPHPMSKEDADRFRVAFVVFVASNLLCPAAKYDYASVDYWNAIQDPDAISSYDWSEFVITRLLEGVTKLKQDIADHIKFPNITGCSIFLQVLYLDSLQLDGLTLSHNMIPRVRDFCYDRIMSMIKADKNFARHVTGNQDLDVGKLRDASECIYSWALEIRPQHVKSMSGCLLDLWRFAVTMAHLLNIPPEAAGPLFVAAADFQDQINSRISVNGIEAIEFLSFFFWHLISPYTRGFTGHSSYATSAANTDKQVLESAISIGISLMSFPIRKKVKQQCNCLNERMQAKNGDSTSDKMSLTHMLIDDGVQSKINSALSSLNAHILNVNLRATTTMSKFYSLFRMRKPANDFDLNVCAANDFDLNVCAAGAMCSPSSSLVSAGVECDVLPSPWQLGYHWSLIDVNHESLFERIIIMQGVESLVIVHREPKYIQVSSCTMCGQFLGRYEMELDLFDTLIRIARQEDDLLFSSYGSLRWRHFFESDFMGIILSGLYDLVDSKLRDHLSLSDLSYDLSKSKIVFFPLFLQCQWVCFAWQPEKNVIYVFDPSGGTFLEKRVELIECVCNMLKLALKMLSGTVFVGVSNDATSADLCIMNIADAAVSRLNRTGLLCSLFYRCFDGYDLTPSFPKVDVKAVAAKLFHQIRNLKQNSGTFNTFFYQLL